MKKMRFAAILTVCALLTGTASMPAAEMPLALTAGAQEPDYVPEYTHGVLTYHNWGDHIVIIKCDAEAESVEIPTELDGLPVTAIGDHAFLGCTHLAEITIPEGITSIGTKAFFDCKNLMEISLPETLERIGYEAFEGTGWMIAKRAVVGKVIVNDTLISGSPSMKAAMIPNDITKIADHAFANFYDLDTVGFHEGVTDIGQYTFKNCGKLTEIALPESLSELGKGAFMATGLKSVSLPETITEVPEELCNGCADLSEVTLHDGITAIGGDAFSSCPSLHSITIPQSVTKLGDAAFFASGLTSVEIPDSVTELGDSLFSNCEELTEVRLPHGIDTIPTMLFNYCPALCHVEIPDTVTSIGENAFADTGLTSVIIPEGVTEIKWGAFENAKLATVYLPASLTKIDGYAFSGCPLTDVYYAGTEEEWNAVEIEVLEDFESRPFESAVIHYEQKAQSTEPTEPEYVKGEFCNYIRYSDHIEIDYVFGSGEIVIPAEIDGLPVTVFPRVDSAEITGIVLPDTLTELPYFYRCYNLETIVLPQNLTAIDDWTFVECENLKHVVIPDSVTSIGEAFEACPSLTTINIPANVQTIADGAFANCENLEKIEISPDHPYFVYEDGILMDADRTRVIACAPKAVPEKIVLPDTVTSIGKFAFANCKALQELVIPDSVTHIGAAAFYYCESLKTLSIPEGVTALDAEPCEGGSYDTFENCTALETLCLPATLTSATYETFSGCKNLKEICFAGTEEQWNAIRILLKMGGAEPSEMDEFYGGYAYDEEQDRYVELEFAPTMHYNYVPEPTVAPGNLNADNTVDASDAAMLLTAAAAAGTGADSGLSEAQLAAADLNEDGAFDAKDAALILQYAAYAGAGGDMTIDEYLKQE